MGSLIGKLKNTQGLTGKVNNKEVLVYPELENLEVTPTAEEQNFKSSKYGFDNVKVKPVEGDVLEVTPSLETQNFTGLYEEINVKAIETEELKVTPNTSEQNFEGLYSKVNVEAISGEKINIVPSTEEQVKEGLFSKVTVAGDSNLIPENIKSGVSVFGVDGNYTGADIKITDAKYLFYNGARIDSLDGLLKMCDKVISTYSMFNNCAIASVDLSNFDNSNSTNSSYMFANNKSLKNINLNNFNTSKVTDMSYMFSGDNNLPSIDLSGFDTSNVTKMNSMFYGCLQFTDLDLNNFDASKVVSVGDMFYNCSRLINLKFMKNLGKGYTQKTTNYSNYKLVLSSATKLTYESLMDVINNLYDLNLSYDVANGGTLYTQSLVLGSTNLAKLTADEINVAVLKGWSVS